LLNNKFDHTSCSFYVSTEEQKVRRAHMASYTAVAVLGVASPPPTSCENSGPCVP